MCVLAIFLIHGNILIQPANKVKLVEKCNKDTTVIMRKKIVVITGSPRKKGNSFAMTDAFIQAAEAKEHQITRFDAAFMNVSGCHACELCYKTGKASDGPSFYQRGQRTGVSP